MRPRRSSGASGRPLNFTVRRPLMTPRRWVCPLGLCFVFALQGCGMPRSHGPADVNGAATRENVLLKLKQCLADARTTGGDAFVSSCFQLNG
jgi:hypothetical protein